jgi:hypothetical protein
MQVQAEGEPPPDHLKQLIAGFEASLLAGAESLDQAGDPFGIALRSGQPDHEVLEAFGRGSEILICVMGRHR